MERVLTIGLELNYPFKLSNHWDPLHIKRRFFGG